jgi:hypothetical protein
LQKTNGTIGADRTHPTPILYIALLVVAGAAAVAYGVASAYPSFGPILMGKLLQTTSNSTISGPVIVQNCQNKTSPTG